MVVAVQVPEDWIDHMICLKLRSLWIHTIDLSNDLQGACKHWTHIRGICIRTGMAYEQDQLSTYYHNARNLSTSGKICGVRLICPPRMWFASLWILRTFSEHYNKMRERVMWKMCTWVEIPSDPKHLWELRNPLQLLEKSAKCKYPRAEQ